MIIAGERIRRNMRRIFFPVEKVILLGFFGENNSNFCFLFYMTVLFRIGVSA